MRYALRDSHHVKVVHANMEEAGRAEGDNGRTDVAVGDDLYPEHVGDGTSSHSKRPVNMWS